MQFEIKNYRKLFFHTIIGICAFAMLSVMGVYSYLGIYSRYIADDYCEAVRVTRSSPISAVVERYQAGDWRAANRYSNLLFVGFSELIGGNNYADHDRVHGDHLDCRFGMERLWCGDC
ncbi:hypothetical protein [Candidatus Villigracilis saccharophilus]|uniref:hypothetical protein n=1 Tax=Candidatus Villigracilis saccharophilus TaxID=3140684 RepID=UPI003136A276|nr:hypothetical protein [Anaerolineales bacterium]